MFAQNYQNAPLVKGSRPLPLILEIGEFSTKAGFAGEERPSFINPTVSLSDKDNVHRLKYPGEGNIRELRSLLSESPEPNEPCAQKHRPGEIR